MLSDQPLKMCSTIGTINIEHEDSAPGRSDRDIVRMTAREPALYRRGVRGRRIESVRNGGFFRSIDTRENRQPWAAYCNALCNISLLRCLDRRGGLARKVPDALSWTCYLKGTQHLSASPVVPRPGFVVL